MCPLSTGESTTGCDTDHIHFWLPKMAIYHWNYNEILSTAWLRFITSCFGPFCTLFLFDPNCNISLGLSLLSLSFVKSSSFVFSFSNTFMLSINKINICWLVVDCLYITIRAYTCKYLPKAHIFSVLTWMYTVHRLVQLYHEDRACVNKYWPSIRHNLAITFIKSIYSNIRWHQSRNVITLAPMRDAQ